MGLVSFARPTATWSRLPRRRLRHKEVDVRLELAWPWHYRWWGLGVGLAGGFCLLWLPLAWSLRPAAAIAVVLASTALWSRHHRRLPQALARDATGRLRLQCRSGDWLEIERIDVGVVRPWLLSARLHAGGRGRDLFVPGATLDRETHWRLRHLLRIFRPPRGGDGRQAQPPGR
jgi:hypothetical protein